MAWEFNSTRITLARDARDMSQSELARNSGFAQHQIAAWERGDVKMSVDNLAKLCNVLETPPHFFYVQSGQHGKAANEADGE